MVCVMAYYFNYIKKIEMDLQSILISLAAVAGMVAPVVYLHLSRKRRDRIFVEHLIDSAQKQNITMDQHEIWNINYAIGIDSKGNKIFYLKKTKQGEQTIAIDLSEVEKCRVVTKSRHAKTSGGTGAIIDRIDLAFSISGPQKKEKIMEFYDGEESLSLRGEPVIAEKWCGIINRNLKKKPAAVH